jgi:glycogen debranching enzyme
MKDAGGCDDHGEMIRLWPRPGIIEISRGRTFLVCEQDGSIKKERSLEGLYIFETRVLCRYGWRMNGKAPEFSCGSNITQSSWMGYYIQAPANCRETPTGECDALQETLEMRVTRSVGEGLHEEVFLTNHTQISTKVEVELEFEHEFVSREEADTGRRQRGRMDSHWTQSEPNVWELMTEYFAEHHYSHQGNEGVAGLHRGTKLRIEGASSPPKYEQNRISFEAHLPPRGEWHVCLNWLAYVEGRPLPLSTGCAGAHGSDWDQRHVRFLNSLTRMGVGAPDADDLSATVERLLHRSRQDLADLRLFDLDSPGAVAIAAGIPSYDAIFGRDMLASAWQASILGPELLRGSLDVLANMQASEENDWRDAQPGRIAHEVHTDPLSVLNFRPKSIYFGSVSSCLLFPIAVSELWYWTGDLDLIRKYKDTAIRALNWADRYSRDATGFYRYETRSEQGMKNQGWKDSGDAIVYPDGSQVAAPIGTCEMQGFAYAAKLYFSEILWWLGDHDLARQFYQDAEDLKARFNEQFWLEDEGYFGMAIGRNRDLVRSIGSDPGHCLLSGIVDKSRVKRVASRMLQDDLFSGWGIRTLSSRHCAYNPFSYHRGSVWPVENAAFVLAFSRYGLHGEMHQLAKAIFEAADLFEYDRLPELFGGHARAASTPFPGLYTRANSPQAWSASAPFAILRGLLGIFPYAPAHTLFLDPRLPRWLPEFTVRGLRVGKGSVSLKFSRNADGETEYKILDLKEPLHIIRQPSPWSLTSGWAERVKDTVTSLILHR